jgi:hypothetical protein
LTGLQKQGSISSQIRSLHILNLIRIKDTFSIKYIYTFLLSEDLNFTTLLAGTFVGTPSLGFQAFLSPNSLTWNVPKFCMVTRSPSFKELCITSSIDSNTIFVLFWDTPVCFDTFFIISFLVSAKKFSLYFCNSYEANNEICT